MSSSGVEQVPLLKDVEKDRYDGVIVKMKEPMDPEAFRASLRASISQWRLEGKKGVWIKLPIGLSNLVHPAVEEGFWYHHAEPAAKPDAEPDAKLDAEPDAKTAYLMLVYWIPNTPSTLPANASHRVGVGGFVMNSKREVLVVKETSGKLKGMWKLPTGVVDEGEDVLTAARREVLEETGIETETDSVEVLAFRQSHKSFFTKSDLLFVCLLVPTSFEIKKQIAEIEAAQWMPIDAYADQASVKKNQQFSAIAEICIKRSKQQITGFTPKAATTGSGKKTYIYCPK
ncbi:nudix hydrolase 7-like [Punica granatum]|uniref:Nudix hydrolase domain-containing protein n=2 Tax=Punica granatum TaxID=22663 RepID=A0A218X508_PUNGR|nr:nudix hydrolase 7-like [Punica granatum]OWM80014.1 hypothetical protein CDL15_Pgr009992 [Punica granatum]PKI33705.1 hypothetical protein CRG98_045897 [Punica granatum]